MVAETLVRFFPSIFPESWEVYGYRFTITILNYSVSVNYAAQ